MITFSYQARDAAGRIVSGIQEALNEDNAVTSLMSRGLMVLSLQRKATAQSRKKSTKVKETDLVLFTRQLSALVGVSFLAGASFAPFVQTGRSETAGRVASRNQRYHSAGARW